MVRILKYRWLRCVRCVGEMEQTMNQILVEGISWKTDKRWDNDKTNSTKVDSDSELTQNRDQWSAVLNLQVCTVTTVIN